MAQWLAFLLLDPAAPGLILHFLIFFRGGEFMMLQCWLVKVALKYSTSPISHDSVDFFLFAQFENSKRQ